MNYHIAFPFAIDPYTKQIMTANDRRYVQDSMYCILMTHVKQRWMLPSFGSRVHDYVYETMDATMLEQLKKEIIASLKQWGFSLQEVQVLFQLHEHTLEIEVMYTMEQETFATKLSLELR